MAMEYMNVFHYCGHLIKCVVIVDIFSSWSIRFNCLWKEKDTLAHNWSNVLK